MDLVDGRSVDTCFAFRNPMEHVRAGFLDLRRKLALCDDFEDVLQRGEARTGPGVDPETAALQAENRRILWQGLNRLPSEVRLAVVLKELQGKKYEEVAEILGLPLGTVKSRINRGKLMLAKILREKKDA